MWLTSDFTLEHFGQAVDVSDLTHWAYTRTGRTDFFQPGFCLIDLGTAGSSESLRRLMVGLFQSIRGIHREATGSDLICLSAARFDQQVTTRPHRDGAPDQSVLMLGYEPSEVRAELALSDYSKRAFEMGLTPTEFLDQHNPMFRSGEGLLQPYTTRVDRFSNQRYQVLLINNSMATFSTDRPAWQGVLHTATILNPSDGQRRVVNSIMTASVPNGTPEVVTESQLEEFATTRLVRRRGYDKVNLSDD